MRIDYFFLPAFAALVFACGGRGDGDTAVASATDAASALGSPAQDDAAEFESLFDGASLDAHWHTYGGGDVGAAWAIAEDGGSFHLDAAEKDADGHVVGGGDIVTDASFDAYELILEWRIADCGNSGIIYNVTESEEYPYPWMTGPEMQILDDTCHPDAKIRTHRAGDLYDMVEGDSTAVRPAGEWNEARLVVRDGRVEHHLNGVRMVGYANEGEAWEAMIAESKFAEMPGFGKTTGGRIALQDHGDEVHFRNVRVREL